MNNFTRTHNEMEVKTLSILTLLDELFLLEELSEIKDLPGGQPQEAQHREYGEVQNA
jgi:hypothetical protein